MEHWKLCAVIPDTDQLAEQFQSSELFRVVVGPEETVYHLHKRTLAERCPYFAGLLSFRGIETTKDKVTLSDISVRAFKVFITYVYTNVYSIPDLSYDESFVLHAEVYILADRMCMTDLRTVAFNRVKENVVKGGLNVQHVSRVVEYVYDNTPDRDLDVPGVKEETGSGNTQEIRMLLAKLCCYNLKALMNHRLLPRVLRRHGELAIDMLHRLKDL